MNERTNHQPRAAVRAHVVPWYVWTDESIARMTDDIHTYIPCVCHVPLRSMIEKQQAKATFSVHRD